MLGDHLLVGTTTAGEKPEESAVRLRSKSKAVDELRTDLFLDVCDNNIYIIELS